MRRDSARRRSSCASTPPRSSRRMRTCAPAREPVRSSGSGSRPRSSARSSSGVAGAAEGRVHRSLLRARRRSGCVRACGSMLAGRADQRFGRVRHMTALGSSDLDVFPLCLGGNVFGWTADEADSFAVLDAFIAAPAATSSTPRQRRTRPGCPGTRAGSRRRSSATGWPRAATATPMIVATKVGHDRNLTREAILEGAKRSLERLQTDRIDLYYIHNDDPDTPLEESLGAFGELVGGGQRALDRRSNFTAARLAEALDGRRARRAAGGRRDPERVQPASRATTRTACGDVAAARRRRRCPLLRAGVRLPHGQVPPGRRRRRQPARAVGARAASTSAASPCSTRSTRSRGAFDDAGRRRARVARGAAHRRRTDRLGAHGRAARGAAAVHDARAERGRARAADARGLTRGSGRGAGRARRGAGWRACGCDSGDAGSDGAARDGRREHGPG